MKKITICALLALAAPVLAQDTEPVESVPGGPGFQLIVHASNPSPPLDVSTIANMFTRRARRWEHGELTDPVDLPPDSEVREAFSRVVHGRRKSISAIEAYYQRLIFTGRGVPPEKRPDDAAVIQFVADRPGAIGYVSSRTELPDTVKVLGWEEKD